MIINNYFNFEISYNGSDIEAGAKFSDFQIKDSIHKLLPEVSMTISDMTGTYIDSLVFLEGSEFGIKYKNEESESQLNLKLVLNKYELSKLGRLGIINGEFRIKFEHFWYGQSRILSSAFNNDIESIIKILARQFPSKLDIEPCNNGDRILYCPMKTDLEFLNSLKYIAKSRSNPNSIYFIFIRSDNTLIFRTYESLYNKKPIASLSYKTQNSGMTKESILDIRPFNVGLENTMRARNIRTILKNKDGTFEASNIKVIDNNTQIKTPSIGDSSLETDFNFIDYSLDLKLDDDNIKDAHINNSIRESYFYEKFYIKLILNTDIQSGETVDIKVDINTESGQEEAIYLSGKYLVEESIHSWSRAQNSGFTEIIISRPKASIPNNFNYRDKILK